MNKTTDLAPETLAAQALHHVEPQTGGFTPPNKRRGWSSPLI